MTQEERWKAKYNEVMDFMEKNHRSPSRHRSEEHVMLNWLKSNRKKMNAGELKKTRSCSMVTGVMTKYEVLNIIF